MMRPAAPPPIIGNSQTVPSITLPRLLLLSAAGTVLLAPVVVVDAAPAYLGILAVFTSCLWPLSRVGTAEERTAMFALFGLAVVLKLGALTLFHWWAIPAGGPFLGPDSTRFYEGSLALAEAPFDPMRQPLRAFGNAHVAHYYLNAGAILAFGADVFSLQLMNSGLIALVAPLTYSWVRRVAPGLALPAGLLVALHPSLTVLGALDLLKDPSVLFTATLAVWAFAHLPAVATRGKIVLAVVLLGALCYLVLDRFYVAAYLQIALVASLILAMVRRRWQRLDLATVALTLLVVIGGEVLLVQLGWWSATARLGREVSSAMTTSRHLRYPPGLLGRSTAGEPRSAGGARVKAEDPPPGAEAWTTSPTVGVRPDAQPTDLEAAARVASAVDRMPEPLGAGSVVLVDAVRKIFGPFVWIAPRQWEARHVLVNDYPLYPGMLVWYALWPWIAGGFLVVAVGLRNRYAGSPPVVVVWVFSAMLLGQYILTNMAYRHRETMFPFLAVLALLALDSSGARWQGRLYRWYWLLLALVAVVHLTLRSGL